MIRLTRKQAREIDRRSIEQYHVPGVVLMENAARAAADEACDMMDHDCSAQVLILCGGGNNGGDGLAVARHLHNLGTEVFIRLTADPAQFRNEAAVNWRIVQAMGLNARRIDLEELDVLRPLMIVDAVFGTGLSEPPREPFGALVRAVDRLAVPILAVDVPSGLDCDTGKPLGPVFPAQRTVTFVAEKTGFQHPTALDYLGRIVVADIGCPREVVETVARET